MPNQSTHHICQLKTMRSTSLNPLSPHRGFNGFSLVELLIGTVLLAAVIGGTAGIMSVANRTSSRGALSTVLDSLIDQDIAAINDVNYRFTCCPGSCTSTSATITAAVTAGTCATSTSGTQNYYSPVQSSGSTINTAMVNFRTACTGGNGGTIPSLASSFISSFPTLPTSPTGATLTRSTPTNPEASTGTGERSHLVQWTYTGSVAGATVVSRTVNLVPTVAAWCIYR